MIQKKQSNEPGRFLEKIVINAGIGKLKKQQNFEDKVLPEIEKEMAQLSGQKPARRKAKQSIAGFDIREGDIIGLQITLRKARMDDFIKKLVTVVFPRVKDFRGIDPKHIDHHGSLNVGFKDQYVFPEINLEKSRTPFGIQVTCVLKIRDRQKAIDFYRSVGVPLRK